MSSPVLHYEFNTSPVGTDSSGSGLNLSTTSISLVTDAERGIVASFNGTSSRGDGTVPSSASGSNPRTHAYWVKKTGSQTNSYIHSQGSSSSVNWGAFIQGSNYRSANPGLIGSGLVSGEWNHLAITYDGTDVTIYVNGVQKSTTSYVANSSGSMQVGYVGINPSFPLYFEGLMSDFRVYDVALSPSEIFSLFTGPTFTFTPWSTHVETEWINITGATSYRLTKDSGSGESIAVDNTTSSNGVFHNLVPNTTYTWKLYYSTDGTNYIFFGEDSTSTLSDTLENSNLTIFLTNGVYDLSFLNNTTFTILNKYINSSLTTGDKIVYNFPGLNETKLTVVTRGSTSTIPEGEAILFPFDQSDGSSQSSTLELSDTSTVLVSYDDSTNTINIEGEIYGIGDYFVLDGMKATVYDV